MNSNDRVLVYYDVDMVCADVDSVCTCLYIAGNACDIVLPGVSILYNDIDMRYTGVDIM